MTSEADRWYDDAAGPVVRPYAMTRGRTSHAAEARLDLIALVVARSAGDAHDAGATRDGAGDTGDTGPDSAVTGPGTDLDRRLARDGSLSPEQLEIVRLCREQATSLAELAAEVDLPVGVVRVMVGDLLEAGYVTVHPPVPPAELPDERILREVIIGLRAL